MDARAISRIKSREKRRLRKFLVDAPISTRGAIQSLAEELCDLKVLMAQAKELLAQTGLTQEYNHGGGQRGVKRSAAFEILNAQQKTYAALMGRMSALIVASITEEGGEKE